MICKYSLPSSLSFLSLDRIHTFFLKLDSLFMKAKGGDCGITPVSVCLASPGAQAIADVLVPKMNPVSESPPGFRLPASLQMFLLEVGGAKP